jgi:hypothetical protein
MKSGKRTRRILSVCYTYQLSVVLVFCLFLGGCRSREETLYSLGNFVFFVYLIALLTTLNIKRFHRWPLFIKLAKHTRKLCLGISILIAVLGVFICVIGLYFLFADVPATHKLTFFLGTISLILGRYLWLWAKTDNLGQKTTFAKVVTLSLSFGIAVLYLVFGGPMLK